MDWFCCGSHRLSTANQVKAPPFSSDAIEPITTDRTNNDSDDRTIMVQEFTFQELADATQNFSLECLVGEGFYGIVYKGKLRETGEIVAVRLLDDYVEVGGHREYLSEMLALCNFRHPNLLYLIGYYIGEFGKFLVHEYLPLGSLHQHLHDKQKLPLDWFKRMKIALGIARAIEWLHCARLIHVNLKSTNILLDNDFNAKLSFRLSAIDEDFSDEELLKINGYIEPEYILTGYVTEKTDVYSFGVVLLEMITGQKAYCVDSNSRKHARLDDWARKKIKTPKKFPELSDPLLEGNFPAKGFNQALAVATKCIRYKRTERPMMSKVVTAIMCLTSDK